jgi:DNA-binding ferritin-like protein
MTTLVEATRTEQPTRPEQSERPLIDILQHMRRPSARASITARGSEPGPEPAPWAVTLANTFDLKCRVMQARWYARHAGAASLAGIYDEMNDDLDLLADLLGQRILATGGQPQALAPHVIRHSSLPPQRLTLIGRDTQAPTLTFAITSALRQLATSLEAAHKSGDQPMVEILQRLQRRLTNRKAALAQLLDSPAPAA